MCDTLVTIQGQTKLCSRYSSNKNITQVFFKKIRKYFEFNSMVSGKLS
jgi:hypothetical protein